MATPLFGLNDRALEARHRAVERYLASALPAPRTIPTKVHEAMRYATLAPGKRIRPLLVLAACEAVGGVWRRALPAAAAVECVHAFSLVHDDLPAMDDDDYRRGRLTTHRKFGEAIGILAGDALFALAFAELSKLDERGVSPGRVVAAVRCLSEASGSRQLVGGQVLDLLAENRRVTRADVKRIHERKTAALVRCALRLGGIVGGASEAKLGRLERIGDRLGLAFQIHDDLLNVGSSLRRLGKRAGTDAARGKATWPSAVGESRARDDAAALYTAALAEITTFGGDGRILSKLVMAVAERQR